MVCFFSSRRRHTRCALVTGVQTCALPILCEALHLAGIEPGRASGRISKQRLERLAVAIKEVLSAAILAGGSTLRDYARPDGELGYFSKQWRVYGREGAACLCGSVIRRRTDSGRSTFYCPKCQR